MGIVALSKHILPKNYNPHDSPEEGSVGFQDLIPLSKWTKCVVWIQPYSGAGVRGHAALHGKVLLLESKRR